MWDDAKLQVSWPSIGYRRAQRTPLAPQWSLPYWIRGLEMQCALNEVQSRIILGLSKPKHLGGRLSQSLLSLL